jgi:hypothetical protein
MLSAAKHLVVPGTEHEILRPEFIPSLNSEQALSPGRRSLRMTDEQDQYVSLVAAASAVTPLRFTFPPPA